MSRLAMTGTPLAAACKQRCPEAPVPGRPPEWPPRCILIWAMYTLADLETAELHVEQAKLRIAEQRERIEEFRAKGWDLHDAEIILQDMLRLLPRIERHRDEIARELERE